MNSSWCDCSRPVPKSTNDSTCQSCGKTIYTIGFHGPCPAPPVRINLFRRPVDIRLKDDAAAGGPGLPS